MQLASFAPVSGAEYWYPESAFRGHVCLAGKVLSEMLALGLYRAFHLPQVLHVMGERKGSLPGSAAVMQRP